MIASRVSARSTGGPVKIHPANLPGIGSEQDEEQVKKK
jgi:hypothetical protein